MSPAEQQQLKALIVATALYYGQEIPDPALKLYVEDLADLPFAVVAEAIKQVRRDPKTTRFPLPAVIRDKIAPAETDELQAMEAAARIPEAVSRFGWNNPGPARLFIGELGWVVVQRDGGWSNVCQVLNEDNLGTLKAQWRNLALGELKRARMGILHEAPSLPNAAEKNKSLVNIGDVLKALPKPEGAA